MNANVSPRPVLGGAEHDDPAIVTWRIASNIGDAFVKRQQDAPFALNTGHQFGIAGAGQPLFGNRLCLVTGDGDQLGDFGRQILIELEHHSPLTGRRLSSRASSAA